MENMHTDVRMQRVKYYTHLRNRNVICHAFTHRRGRRECQVEPNTHKLRMVVFKYTWYLPLAIKEATDGRKIFSLVCEVLTAGRNIFKIDALNIVIV